MKKVVIEGIQGSRLEDLVDHLIQASSPNLKVRYTRPPSPFKGFKDWVTCLTAAMEAWRDAAPVLLFERSMLAQHCYVKAYAESDDLGQHEYSLFKQMIDGITHSSSKPDMIILVDCPAEIAKERLADTALCELSLEQLQVIRSSLIDWSNDARSSGVEVITLLDTCSLPEVAKQICQGLGV